MMNYCLPPRYQENAEPKQYVDHDDGVTWQPGAYALGYRLVGEHKLRSVVDIGCGGARKLRRFADAGLPVIGYDAAHPKKEPWMQQRSTDLDRDASEDFLAGADLPALVMCADVIEHLRYPMWLISTLIAYALHGNVVIITTPDRILEHGKEHLGPPPNPAHVREWTKDELVRLVSELVPESRKHELKIDANYTQTTDLSPEEKTITLVLRSA